MIVIAITVQIQKLFLVAVFDFNAFKVRKAEESQVGHIEGVEDGRRH